MYQPRIYIKLSNQPLISKFQWDLANYIYLFSRLDELSNGMEPQLIPPRVQYIMLGATSNIKGVFYDFPTPILPEIGGEPKRELLIDLYQLFSRNASSVASKIGGIRNGPLSLKIKSK